ncbi:SGNH/GDSL hydrolase family protein [Chryseobacterium indoltheticum]|uniref:Lysophospholipase L1 n=1 Tax=Chryseobacterium indoltheticum TaxID=254 RepID=A0A381FAF5_9FLAO|nr:SGNH/GDSL hydrolase family protein [Chryseobacterium indoltheticum]AZA73581.1 SGNH/GDSL hydrolase family protein [Chryseobacterium indoltheticum]SIR23774.1 Lysophospholipase L1 [Chryseobacterium indoltheticum]SUX43551.1 Uncharacterised protein [Chryseobacterium indoltheticum]
MIITPEIAQELGLTPIQVVELNKLLAFINVKSVSELTEVLNPVDGNIPFEAADGTLYKVPINTFYQLIGGLAKPISPSDATPTVIGWYKPRVYSADPGTNYPNLDDLKAVEGYDTLFYFDGTDWIDIANRYGVRSINDIEKTSTVGLVDTYNITFTDGSTPTTFEVTNGKSITDWTASNYVEKSTVIKNGSIYYLSDGQTATSSDIPGVSSKWVLKISGAGVLDLDKNFPLSSGFYTPDTARLAVPVALRRAGLIIYYATATDHIIEKFNSSVLSQWTVSTHWIRYTDINDLKKHNVSGFLLPDSVLTNYNADSIINLGKVNYVENSDQLYISVLKKTPPVFQVSNDSGVLIGSYAVSTGTGTGVKEIEIKNVGSNPGTTTLFKALVNWDLLKENDNLQQQLHINTTVNYLNDLPKQVDSKLQNVIVKDNFYLKSENFFDKNDPNILQEKWIPSNSTTGTPEVTTLASILTGFIGPFKTGDKVNATIFGNPDKHPPAWIAVFDENKNIITKSSILLLGYDGYTMLEGEKYIRIAPRKTDIPLTDVPNLMVTANQRITSPYIPYGYSKYLNPLNTIVTGGVRSNQTGVVFADSIGELSNWTNIAGKLLGCNLINCAIGGTRMALHQITPNDYDAFSAYNLAEAVVSGNWSRQEAAAIAIRDNTGDDNVYIVNRMKAINWALVDFIVLAFGTNDLTGGTCPIGTNADNTGTTIKGAMNLFLSKIQTAFPKIEILVITPIYRNIEGVSSDTYANGRTPPVTMKGIIDAEEEIAKINHIDVLTMYDNLGMNAKTLTTYTVDGTHLSDFGAQKYALKVANKLG